MPLSENLHLKGSHLFTNNMQHVQLTSTEMNIAITYHLKSTYQKYR